MDYLTHPIQDQEQAQREHSGLAPSPTLGISGLGNLDPTQIFTSATDWLGKVQTWVSENPLIAVVAALGLVLMVSNSSLGLDESNDGEASRGRRRR